MRLTLNQKRAIVRQFGNGKSINLLALDTFLHLNKYEAEANVQLALRDFINGKFTLTPKPAKVKK